MNIIIVEDEGITAFFLKEVIEDLEHEVVGVFDEGNGLLDFLKDNSVDLIFMDIQINGSIDGIQLANIIYRKYPDIKFIFLTSYKDSETILNAQVVKPMGYIIKPVVEKDIEAILMVVGGRDSISNPKKNNKIIFGEYMYDLDTKTLYRGEEYIALAKNERSCFHTLILHRDTTVSAEQLIFSIWGDEDGRLSSLRELTYRLRKKIPGISLTNILNIGYILSTKLE